MQKKDKVFDLKNEFINIANFYNLHLIEVHNLFIEALKIVYLKRNEVVYLNDSNQLFFYNPKTKYCHFFNISQDKFSKLYKTFHSSISKRSDENSKKSFYKLLEKNKYVEVILTNKTRKYAYFKLNDKSAMSLEIQFVAKINNKLEDDFLNNNKTIWIKFDKAYIDYIYKSKGNYKLIKCNIIDYDINKKFINHYFEEIRTKTNGRFSLSIKGFNKEKSIIHIDCNDFMPKTFIEHIETIIKDNTTYSVFFIKPKKNPN